MLDAGNIVAFVPISDAEKARAFYEGLLGLRFVIMKVSRPFSTKKSTHSTFQPFTSTVGLALPTSLVRYVAVISRFSPGSSEM